MSGGLWAAIGGVFGLIFLVMAVITIVDVFRSHLGSGRTAAWVIIVVLLPFVGSVLYWVLKKPTRDDVEYQFESERAMRESAHNRPFDSTGIS